MRQHLFACILAMFCLLPACDVHEFPDPPLPPVELKLNLKFKLGLGILVDFKTIYIETRAVEDSAAFEARYQLRFHPLLADGSFDRDSCIAYTFNHDELEALDFEAPLSLVPGRYHCRAWVDFVPTDSVADHFYDTTDFDAITLRRPYEGNTDYCDAFRGTKNFEVFLPELMPDQTLHLEMERPVAKYRFIATDLKEFTELRLKDTDGDLNAAVPPIDLTQYKVVVSYDGFLPSIFNLTTDRPVDAITGISFSAPLTQLTDEEVEMAFDYVLVGPQEGGVNLSLTIYDEAGKLVSAVPSMVVPLQRGQLTTVRGKFLTSRSEGAVSIDPSFEGEFNLQIP